MMQTSCDPSQPSPNSKAWRWIFRQGSVGGVCLASVLLLMSGCGKTEPNAGGNTAGESAKQAVPTSDVNFAAVRPEINRFCGDCHAVPKPETFPRKAWYEEVAQGYRFYEDSGRSDLAPPPMSDVVAYYQHFAPEELELPPVRDAEEPARWTFRTEHVRFPADREEPGVSQLTWIPFADNGPHGLFFCDMRTGDVQRVDFSGEEPTTETLASLNHPAAIHPVDFGDHRPGFVVAELGTFLPGDHDKGRVSWLHESEDKQRFESVVLAENLGRVADVRPADFNGDGKLDLIVAEFGWRKTGRILLLKQTRQENGIPQFEEIVVDPRHGAIHVPVADLNGDGQPDFIALVSQEHEAIDAFLNQGGGQFERQRIFQADDPSYGSSGIELVDLDQDGDLDVLYTNGDSLDSHYLKPYHAVHWLENQGTFPFVHHELTTLPGASRAIPVDLDGDGDLDIVCSAYLPPRILNQVPGGKIDTLIWLEQQGKGQFARHVIERAASGHLALAAGDFNGDGSPDLAAGAFQPDAKTYWIMLWLTQDSNLLSK